MTSESLIDVVSRADSDTRVGHPSTPDKRLGPTIRSRLRLWAVRRALRLLMSAYGTAVTMARRLRRHRPAVARSTGRTILLTGTFHSENWIAAQLRPLAASGSCARICVVSTHPVPRVPKVAVIRPSALHRRILGDVPARLVTFAWMALHMRPDIVGGFHLLVNGLLAALLAPLVGARSMYICTGGSRELLDGGIWAGNRLFGKLETPDTVVERQLLGAARKFDLLVVRGERTRRFFREAGVCAPIHVVTGGVDAHRFSPARNAAAFDLIIVARLAPEKRVDVFLRATQIVARQLPAVRACVLGEGPLRGELEGLAGELGIADRVRFVGQRNDVERWLRRARIFVLTSDTEGLAISLIEAMMCGLPAIVSDVGELADLVDNNVNGYRVPRRSPEAFATRIVELLANPQKLKVFSALARKRALRYDTDSVCQKWTEVLIDPM